MPEQMATKRLRVIAIALVAIVSLGTREALASPEPLPNRIEFRPSYFDSNFSAVDSSAFPKSVVLRIAVITGSFGGVVNGPDITQITTNIGQRATLDIDAITPKLAALSESLRADGTESELLVTPKEARFGRLATLVAYPEGGAGVGSATFRRSRDEALLLVYFDRACSVLGVVHLPRGEISYNLVVPRSGMYVMKLVRESQSVGRAELSAAPPILTLAIVPAK